VDESAAIADVAALNSSRLHTPGDEDRILNRRYAFLTYHPSLKLSQFHFISRT
jgi:hypothetical protein